MRKLDYIKRLEKRVLCKRSVHPCKRQKFSGRILRGCAAGADAMKNWFHVHQKDLNASHKGGFFGFLVLVILSLDQIFVTVFKLLAQCRSQQFSILGFFRAEATANSIVGGAKKILCSKCVAHFSTIANINYSYSSTG